MNSLVKTMKEATNFRVFLRNYFYPSKQQVIQDSMYNCIPDLSDIDYSTDTLEYKLKCKKKKSTTLDTYDYQIEDSIVNTLRLGNITDFIQTSFLDDTTKYCFGLICNDIFSLFHMSGYLKVLYNMMYFPINTTTRMVVVTL